VDAKALDLAPVVDGQLALEVHVPGETGGDEVAGLVLDPLDRPADEDRRQRGDDVAGIDGDLVAEPSADVGGDDPDHVLGQLRHQRHRGADDVGRLRGHVDRQLGGGRVVVGDAAAALDRRRVRPGVEAVELDHPVGPLEDPVGHRPVADLPGVADVVGLAVLVVPDQGRVGGGRLHRVDDGRQRVVDDLDGLAGVLGDVGVVGHDRRDLLALEADLVHGDHGLRVVGQRGHPGQVPLGHQLPRQHQVHAGDGPGLGRVDRHDAGVGVGAAEDLHVQHPRQLEVVGVVALAPDEAVVLHPLDPGADPSDGNLVNGHLAS